MMKTKILPLVLLVVLVVIWQTQRFHPNPAAGTPAPFAVGGKGDAKTLDSAMTFGTSSVSNAVSAGSAVRKPPTVALPVSVPAGKLIQPGSIPDRAVDLERDFVLANGHKAHPSHLLAKFAKDATEAEKAVALQAFQVGIVLHYTEASGLVLLDAVEAAVPPRKAGGGEAIAAGKKLLERIQLLQQTGVFAYVEPDYIVTVNATPSDAAFANGTLWGLRNTGQSGGVAGADIGAVQAWDITTGSTNVVVAVIDSGVRYTHQDLASQMWRNPDEIEGNGIDDDGNGYVDDVFGINAINDSGDPMDDHDHGSHCAGTIGAAANDGHPHVGVAWQVRLMGCKFIYYFGAGTTSDAIQCVQYATSKRVKIMSNSWGGSGFSQALSDAIAAARDEEILFVAAAGNSAVNADFAPFYPAGMTLDNVISVAALDRGNNLASFSNYGSQTVDVGAPGVDIYSSTASSDISYQTFSGTSMAAPHVSGVAALVLAQFPNLTLAELRQRLLITTVPTAALAGKSVTGGRINAYNALAPAPNGRMEISLVTTPNPLLSGIDATVFVMVTDWLPVTNATVSGTVGLTNLSFQNSGVAPDVTGNDHVYSASFVVPYNVSNVTLTVFVAAPGMTNATNTLICPVVVTPQNNNFSNRFTISSLTVIGSNVRASKETGEPTHAGQVNKSVWWSWTAPGNGPVTITTAGSLFDTLLGVYTGNQVSSLTSIASNDDAEDRLSAVTFNGTSGTVYQIAVDGYFGDEGDITLNVAQSALPGPFAPVITAHPASQSCDIGKSAVLKVTATGDPAPGYQWRFNGTNLAGATASSLTVALTSSDQVGNYSVVVSNLLGSVVSSNAILSITALPAILPAIQWQRSFGATGNDSLSSLQQTTDGGYILGGSSSSGVSGSKTSPNYGVSDYWVVKLDSNGNKVWENSFGGDAYDYLESLQQTSDGGYILGGSSSSGVSGNKTSPDFLAFGLYFDYWVVKLDSNGHKVWENSFGSGYAHDFLQSLQQTSDGGYILGGYSDMGLYGNKTSPSYGSYDYWVIKLNSSGNKIWENSFGGDGDDSLQSLQQTSDGGYILGGYSRYGIGGNKTSAKYGEIDYWVVKLDSSGNKLWEKSFGGSKADLLQSLQQTSDGGYILGGYSNSDISGNKTTVRHSDWDGFYDYWVIKLDGNGHKIWETSFGGDRNDLLESIRQTSDGGYILGGYSDSGASGNKTSANYVGADYWVIKLDGSGNKLSESSFGGEANDYLKGLQQTIDGGYILGGYSDSGASGNKTNANGGGSDYWVIKLGTTVEANRPTITIVSPRINERVTTNNLSITMTGTAKDASGLAYVRYKLNGGSWQFALGTTNWSAPLVLASGTNKVEVKAVDLGGNESTVLSRTFFAVTLSSLTLATNGLGSIISIASPLGTPVNGATLEVGRPYKLTAVPGLHQVFSHWTGSFVSDANRLTFVMQPSMNLTANFIPNPFIPMAGVYHGLFHEGSGITHHSAGFFSINLRTNFTFSGKLLLDGDAVSVSGKFNLDGAFAKTIARAAIGKVNLTLTLALDFTGTDKITGTVAESTNWTADLVADRLVFSAMNPATAYATNYTLLFPPGFEDAADGPTGYGYATFYVGTNGLVKTTSGGLADGQIFKQAVGLSKNGDWPLYAPLYKSQRVYTNLLKTINLATPVLGTNVSHYHGSMLGWLNFPGLAPGGEVNWIKTGWTNAVYPQGFTNQMTAFGATYTIPAFGSPAWAVTSGTVTLTNGNLSAALERDFTFSSDNKVTVTPTNSLVKITVTPKTGLWKGTFRHLDNANKTTPIAGAILQNTNFTGGSFLGTNEAGAVWLQGD